MTTKCPNDSCKWYNPPRYVPLSITRPCKFLSKRGKPTKDCPVRMRAELLALKAASEMFLERSDEPISLPPKSVSVIDVTVTEIVKGKPSLPVLEKEK